MSRDCLVPSSYAYLERIGVTRSHVVKSMTIVLWPRRTFLGWNESDIFFLFKRVAIVRNDKSVHVRIVRVAPSKSCHAVLQTLFINH